MRDEHRVKILDAAQLVAERRLADDADERRWVGRLVAVGLVLGASRRGPQDPRILTRAAARDRRHPASVIALSAAPRLAWLSGPLLCAA